MSFDCATHGWRHLLNPCPLCRPVVSSVTNQSETPNETWFRANYQASEGAYKLTAQRLEDARKRIAELEAENAKLEAKLLDKPIKNT